MSKHPNTGLARRERERKAAYHEAAILAAAQLSEATEKAKALQLARDARRHFTDHSRRVWNTIADNHVA